MTSRQRKRIRKYPSCHNLLLISAQVPYSHLALSYYVIQEDIYYTLEISCKVMYDPLTTVKHLDIPQYIPKKESSPQYSSTSNKSTVSPHTTDQKILLSSGPPCSYEIQNTKCIHFFFPQTFTMTMKFNIKVCQDKLKG